MPTLAQVAEVQPYITSQAALRPSDVTFVERLLAACTRRILNYTGRNFFPDPDDSGTPKTKIFTVRRSAFIRIPDLRTLTAVTLGEVALDGTGVYPGYELWGGGELGDQPFTFIKLLNVAYNPFAGYSNQLAITGRWGFLNVPEDVNDVCAQWVARAYKRRDANYADTVQQGIEGAAFQYLNKVPEEYKMTLDFYRISGARVAVV